MAKHLSLLALSAKFKNDQSLTKHVQLRSPLALGLWENGEYRDCGPDRAYSGNFLLTRASF